MSEERTRAAEAFPYGVEPEIPVDEGTEDDRGADTVNRLLLHGARYHDRDGVFTRWEQGRKGWAWTPMPDWRADRHTVRLALVLHQRMGIEANEGRSVPSACRCTPSGTWIVSRRFCMRRHPLRSLPRTWTRFAS